MHDLAPAIVSSLLFLTVGAVIVLRGPLGRALADRIAGRVGPEPDDRELEHLRAEVEELRGQLAEVQERLDFAERLLAQQRQVAQLKRPE